MDSTTLHTLTQTLSSIYDGSVMILAAWRCSNLISNESGPVHMFRHFRQWTQRMCRRVRWCREFGLAEWASCEYCNSIAICTLFWVIWLRFGHDFALFITPLAMSTLVILIKRHHEHLQR